MASLDETSVREEVARLKAEFEQLSRDGKVTPETGALFKSLLLIVDLILSILLERQTRKTPKNSSLPPSQSGKDETNRPRARPEANSRPGGQTVGNHRHVETVALATVENCDVCGVPLDGVECTGQDN